MKKKIRELIFRMSSMLIPEIAFARQLKKEQSCQVTTSKLEDPVKLYAPCKIIDTQIGRYTYVSERAFISQTNIGRFCSIGPGLLCGWGIHPLNGVSTSPMFYSTTKQNGFSLTANTKVEERKTIIIGNDVFIGMNVTILDGVTIGDGAVIGAGCLVSKDVPPYAIVVGNPMQLTKYRFSPSIISELLKIKWWNFDYYDLKEIERNQFDVEKFIAFNNLK